MLPTTRPEGDRSRAQIRTEAPARPRPSASTTRPVGATASASTTASSTAFPSEGRTFTASSVLDAPVEAASDTSAEGSTGPSANVPSAREVAVADLDARIRPSNRVQEATTRAPGTGRPNSSTTDPRTSAPRVRATLGNSNRAIAGGTSTGLGPTNVGGPR